MNSKERVLTAIEHEEPDKIPLDIWLAPEVADKFAEMLNIDQSKDKFALLRALGNDMLWASIGASEKFSTIYKEDKKIGDNLYLDDWGIKWKIQSHDYGVYGEFVEHPLADLKNYDNYKWPDPLVVEKEILNDFDNLIKIYGKEYAILPNLTCTVWEGSWYLRGLENLLVDLYKNKDLAIEIFDHMMNYHLVIAKELTRMGVDIMWIGDDVANENGPYMDPKMYREMLKPCHAHIIQEVKKINKNIKIAYHSDGKIEWLLDDLIDIGVDIVNPLQPDANNVSEVKKKYGKKLTFWGNVDTRNIMSRGSCIDVVEEVKKVIKTLSPGGGFILCSNHVVQSTPKAVDNTIAYYWAANKFRNYPLSF